MKWLWTLLAAGVLASCAAGYTDKTSPCVCNWAPIGDGTAPA